MKSDHAIALPTGVGLMALTTRPDSRGDLTEVFRNEWHRSPPPVQWSVIRNNANVLRGVHAHARSWDYACVIAGELFVGLHDLRTRTPDVRSALVRLSAERLQVLVIPAGVAHGFYAPRSATLMLGTSAYYDLADHRGCRWNSPELGLDWPCTAPELSARDREAGSYAELRAALLADAAAAHWPV